MRVLRTTLALVLPLALLAGCGGASREGGTGEPEPGSEITVEVRNNVTPPTSLTVWSVTNTGSRQLLGTVPPRRDRSFELSLGRVGRQLQLVAETADGTNIPSRPFIVSRDAVAVEWTLYPNTLTIR
jgi:hypothetical protein